MTRVEGKISADGAFYEFWYGSQLLKRVPLEEAKDDRKHLTAIERNGWEKIQ